MSNRRFSSQDRVKWVLVIFIVACLLIFTVSNLLLPDPPRALQVETEPVVVPPVPEQPSEEPPRFTPEPPEQPTQAPTEEPPPVPTEEPPPVPTEEPPPVPTEEPPPEPTEQPPHDTPVPTDEPSPAGDGTPSEGASEPTTSPLAYIQSSTGGLRYCGLEGSSVWLDIPRGFTSEAGAEFYCTPTDKPLSQTGWPGTAGAWNNRGYLIAFHPAGAPITEAFELVFEIDPVSVSPGCDDCFHARFYDAGTGQWNSLTTAYDPGTARVSVEIDRFLPQSNYPAYEDRFAIALYEQSPTSGTPSRTAASPEAAEETPEDWTATPSPAGVATTQPPSAEPPTATGVALPTHPTRTGIATPVGTAGPSDRSSIPVEVWILIGLMLCLLLAGGALLFMLVRVRGRTQAGQLRPPAAGRPVQPAEPAGRAMAPAMGTAEPAAESAGSGELLQVKGRARPSSLHLSEPVVRVGRAQRGNQIVVDDPSVSGHHAEIRSEDGVHIVQDLDSTNGTFVNGRRLSRPQRLQNGDRVTMGKTEWLYRRGGDTTPMPRP